MYDTDGRARTVDYIADEHGFRAVVNTNEPGTAQSYPAGAIINSPYQEPAAPDANPVSIVHEVPVSVSAHIAQVSHPIKSVVSHAVPASTFDHAVLPATFDHAAPVAVAHTIPSTYSTKSVISHDAPVAVAKAVAVPYAHPTRLAYSPKLVASHATAPIAVANSAPLAYSTKSIVSHATPIKTVAHAAPIAITSPVSYSSKSVIANPVPIAKRYVTSPSIFRDYKSIFNGGLRIGDFGYSHGLLGPRFGGLSYNTKLYNYGLQGHGLGGLLYGNPYGYGYHGYGYGNHGYGYGVPGPYMDGFNYGKGTFGYNGLKSFYY